MKRVFYISAVLAAGAFAPCAVMALPDGWGLVASGGITQPLVTSEEDEGNLSAELILQGSRTWALSDRFSAQALGVVQAKRETAAREFNMTNKGTAGLILQFKPECCGTFSSGFRFTFEKQVTSGLETKGIQFGADHAIWKKVAGEWSAPRVFSGWSNIRFPGSLGGRAKDWVAQGRYELSQGLEARPLTARPSLFGGVGFTLDREGESFNNKLVLDLGARFSWKIGETSVSLDFRGMRDRRFLSDELYTGHQIRLGFRRVF